MSTRVQQSIIIDRPVEKVFAYLTEYRNAPRWQPAILETRVTPERPAQAGMRRLAKPCHGSRSPIYRGTGACPCHGSRSGVFAGPLAACASDLRMMGVRWRARNQLKR